MRPTPPQPNRITRPAEEYPPPKGAEKPVGVGVVPQPPFSSQAITLTER